HEAELVLTPILTEICRQEPDAPRRHTPSGSPDR
ncbi:hypothetical protein ACQSAV_28850, partial [Klebsiella pneumoniae]